MQNYDKNELHKVLVEILDYVVSVCEENNITYFLAYGTLLGAYRHKGFIPWDDDLDIAIPRDDYERFIDILEKKDGIYKIQYDGNEKKYYMPFAKVRKDNTIFIESAAQNMFENNGVYIDIFPLDYVKNPSRFTHKMKSNMLSYLRHILRYSSFPEVYKNKRNCIGHIVEHILAIPIYIFSKKRILKYINKLSKGKSTRDDATHIAQYDEKRSINTMTKDIYFPPCKIVFGEKEYNAPSEVETYLTTTYGPKYMELPPEDQRITHNPVEIKLN